MAKLNVSWRTISTLCRNICNDIRDKLPDYAEHSFVALSRGGLVPGTIICNHLYVDKLHVLGMKSYMGERKGEVDVYQVPSFVDMKKIVIIDDVSDSGDSFNHTLEMLGDLKTVATAALYVKQGTAHIPLFSGITNIEKTQWISFPWENI